MTHHNHLIFSGLFFHVVGEGVVNLSKKAESVTDRESYIDFRLRLLGEQGMIFLNANKLNFVINANIVYLENSMVNCGCNQNISLKVVSRFYCHLVFIAFHSNWAYR